MEGEIEGINHAIADQRYKIGRIGIIGELAQCLLGTSAAVSREHHSNTDDPLRTMLAATYGAAEIYEFLTLDDEVPTPESALLPATGLRALVQQFALLHAALPFAPTERTWLRARLVANHLSEEMLERTAAERAVLISNGRIRDTGGADLLRRWWLWRTERGSFENNGTFPVATRIVGELALIHT